MINLSLMQLNRLINYGTEQHSFAAANRIKTTNIIGLITTCISLSYSLFFLLVLEHFQVGLINLAFTISYLGTNILTRLNRPKLAKIWFFCILMLHLVACTQYYLTKFSGFHLYFFLVPTGVFLLFELRERIEQICLSLLAVVLFLYCENTLNANPMIIVSAATNHLLYQSVILINMIEVIVVLTYFAKQVDHHEQKLITQAATDSLTKLANRHQFFNQGKIKLSQANQHSSDLSLVLFDLDFFKRINDQHGHFVGDKCLIAVADAVRSICRESDLVARIGGEEFVVLLELNQHQAKLKAEQMRHAIEEQVIEIGLNTRINCTASFGIVSTNGNAQLELKDFLILADKALYKAKENGRNRIELHFDNVA
ncbi:GGDEF domain-containing protein [Shewanella maritima]|uniref:GGDEF domain-containing protein n=1 Tax=Shewanella maritima TaxID=2520507 RepID=UPI003736E3C2